MKKLKLDVESLAVETFNTAAPVEPRGTVHGLSGTCPASCGGRPCGSDWLSECCTADATCLGSCNSCGGTCGGSCNGTCGWSCDGYATCGPTEPNVCPY